MVWTFQKLFHIDLVLCLKNYLSVQSITNLSFMLIVSFKSQF